MNKKNLDELSIKLLNYIKSWIDWKTMKDLMEDIWINHPQKLYNRLEKLIKEGFIDEDYNFIRWIEDMKIYLPFFWWAQCWNNWNSWRVDDYPMEKIDIEDYNLDDIKAKNFQKYFVTRAKWKSMEPIIKTWDNLLIKFYDNNNIYNHKNYLIVHNWKAKVKKLIKNDTWFILNSLNDAYPDLEVKNEEELSIIWEFIKVLT
jgi:hypothetical protein